MIDQSFSSTIVRNLKGIARRKLKHFLAIPDAAMAPDLPKQAIARPHLGEVVVRIPLQARRNDMKRLQLRLRVGSVLLFMFAAAAVQARDRINVVYASISGLFLGCWVAQRRDISTKKGSRSISFTRPWR
jgi:hypothetical protein